MHGYIGFWAVTEYSSSDAPNSFSLLLSILYIPQTKLKSAQTYKVQWYCFFHYSILLDKWQMNLVTVTDFLIKLGIKPCMHLLEIGKHFFTKWCHCQTYQNYEQSRQKLGTFLENKVLQKSKFSKKLLIKVGLLVQYSSQIFFFLKDLPIFNTEKWLWKSEFKMFEEVVHNFGKSDVDII